MGVFKAIAGGMGTTFRKPRILVILYVVNVVFAAAAAAPFFAVVQADLGRSFIGSNVRPLDIAWLGEAALKYGNALPPFLAGLLVAGFLYLLLQVFLNGGIVGRLLDREGPSNLGAFFGDCGRYWWRFLRLFLISLVFLVLTLGVVLRLVSALFDPLQKGAPTEWLPLILSNLHLLLALLLLSVVRMIVDYARIAIVADGERRVLKALGRALAFLGKRFFRSWAIYLYVAFLSVSGTVLFYVVLGPLGGPTVPLVIAGLVWMQIYVLFRIWIRMLFVSAQAEFYRSRPY